MIFLEEDVRRDLGFQFFIWFHNKVPYPISYPISHPISVACSSLLRLKHKANFAHSFQPE